MRRHVHGTAHLAHTQTMVSAGPFSRRAMRSQWVEWCERCGAVRICRYDGNTARVHEERWKRPTGAAS